MPSLTQLFLSLVFMASAAWMQPAFAEESKEPSAAPVSNIGIMPIRGMSMSDVEKHFGAPDKKYQAVGKPPITRWIYDGFVVYFEHQFVIHSMATANDD